MKKRKLEPDEKPLVIVSSIPWVRLVIVAWFVAVPAVVAAMWLSGGRGQYGYTTFMAVPVMAGFVCGLLVNAGREWNGRDSFIAMTLTCGAVVTGLLLMKVEGMMCVDGRTRLEGTSWYHHRIWPEWYWSPVTRHVVRGIHERVLEHIKTLVEAADL